MNIYIFKSEAKNELRAFAGDVQGSKLPGQFRPWHAVGVISEGKALPHKFSRADIENAIESNGFQLWRFKPKETASSAAADGEGS
ncbi:MAG: hypothetical protein WDO17_23810 [Alphaproteobacteria bacterium]